jgi:hypothetical protein
MEAAERAADRFDEIINMKLDQTPGTYAYRVRNEGKVEGKREDLLDLLVERFGLVPKPFQEKINSANLQQLKTWLMRILTAKNLQEIFE